ncbi:MAG TPA: PEP-CTERM sorting domain-containing protein [Bryobacteraceae bacterium]
MKQEMIRLERSSFVKERGLRTLAVLLSIGALCVSGGAAYAGNLVINGGFEDGIGAQGPVGWIYTPAYTVPNAYVSTITPHSGTYDFQFASVAGGGAQQMDEISQTIPTTPGEQYILSVWERDFDPFGPRGVTYEWNGVGSTLFPVVPQPHGFDYLLFTFAVTGGPGTTSTLSFAGYDTNGVMYIDDVSVTPASDATATPEPGTLGMLFAGGACLAVGWFRKKR